MFGHTILILPFGLLPIIFIVGWVLFSYTGEGLQKGFGSKIGNGITEYPTEVSMALYRAHENRITFSKDGRSVVLTIASGGDINLDTSENVKTYIKGHPSHDHRLNRNWVDHYTIVDISENDDSERYEIVVSIPDEIVLTDEYIDHEIKNIGIVFKRHYMESSIRCSMYSHGERRTERKNGRLFVYLSRSQIVPGIFDERRRIMSEKQITRNIKNRLWNRVDVRCISLDERTYCGEILGV